MPDPGWQGSALRDFAIRSAWYPQRTRLGMSSRIPARSCRRPRCTSLQPVRFRSTHRRCSGARRPVQRSACSGSRAFAVLSCSAPYVGPWHRDSGLSKGCSVPGTKKIDGAEVCGFIGLRLQGYFWATFYTQDRIREIAYLRQKICTLDKLLCLALTYFSTAAILIQNIRGLHRTTEGYCALIIGAAIDRNDGRTSRFIKNDPNRSDTAPK